MQNILFAACSKHSTYKYSRSYHLKVFHDFDEQIIGLGNHTDFLPTCHHQRFSIHYSEILSHKYSKLLSY